MGIIYLDIIAYTNCMQPCPHIQEQELVTLVAVSYYLKFSDKYRLTMSAGGMQTMRAIIEI